VYVSLAICLSLFEKNIIQTREKMNETRSRKTKEDRERERERAREEEFFDIMPGSEIERREILDSVLDSRVVQISMILILMTIIIIKIIIIAIIRNNNNNK